MSTGFHVGQHRYKDIPMIAESTVSAGIVKGKGRQKSLKDVVHLRKVSLVSMATQDNCRVSVLLI